MEIIGQIQGLLQPLQEFRDGFAIVFAVIGLILGLLQCFAGYKSLRFWCTLIGAIIGFIIGFLVGRAVIPDQLAVQVIIAIVAAILLALVAFKIYLAGVFIYILVTVFGAVQMIPLEGDVWRIVLIIAGIVLGIIAGVLAVKYSRPIIIAFTGVTGALTAVRNFRILSPDLLKSAVWVVLAAAVLALLGILVQFKTTHD